MSDFVVSLISHVGSEELGYSVDFPEDFDIALGMSQEVQGVVRNIGEEDIDIRLECKAFPLEVDPGAIETKVKKGSFENVVFLFTAPNTLEGGDYNIRFDITKVLK